MHFRRIMSIILAAITLLSNSLIFTSCGKKTIVIGYTEIRPLNYKDEDANLVGFDTEFAKAVCEKLGYEIEFHKIKDWSRLESEFTEYHVDCIWNGVTITPEREKYLTFTEPYMTNKQVIVVAADKAEGFNPHDAKIAVESGSVGQKVVSTDGVFAGCATVEVSTQTDTLKEVASGTVTCAMLDYVVAMSMIGEGTDYEKLVILDSYEFEEEKYGVAFAKDNEEIRDEFQKAIDELMVDGTIAKLAKKYNLQELLVK